MRFTRLLLIAIFLICGGHVSFGQNSISLSLFPGYHIINTDQISSSDKISTTDMIFGGMVSSEVYLQHIPLELSVGYSQGASDIGKTRTATTTGPEETQYDINLRYQTIPIEALSIYSPNDQIKLLFGVNMAAQHRTLFFEQSNTKDRLLSFGAGLTGKIQTQFMEIRNTNAAIFANLTARWTEYLIHDAKGRNLDNFTLRHITLAPQFGFRWNLTQQDSHN